MKKLTIYWTDDERGLVANELERLFALQDRPLGKEKKAILVDEIAVSGLSPKAVVAGIRSMIAEDFKTIKLHSILAAARAKMDFIELKPSVGCADCEDKGVVWMKRGPTADYRFGRIVPFACPCERGNIEQYSRPIWNGLTEQMVTNISDGQMVLFRHWGPGNVQN